MATEEEEAEHGGHRQSRGSRCTRSQVVPYWTAEESLTLVSEIAAVERDCRKTISSLQKWKIIVDNCNSLDVNRTVNQCRRQWDSLLSHYKKIKKWESSESESYWSLDIVTRRELGFSEDLDSQVFKAIDNHLKADEASDTDPDDDPEALADGADAVLADYSGVKKQRRHLMHQEPNIEERLKPRKCSTDKKIFSEKRSAEKKAKPLKRTKDEKILLPNSSIKDKEQMMFAKLRENAELITAILKGNLDESVDYVLADLKNAEASQTAFTRRQGDKIIACLGNLGDTLDELCDLVQGCS